MVWLSKREVAYYLILKKKFNGNIFNLGEALDILSLFGSRNIARKIIKRLKSKGFLEGIGVMTYRVKDSEEALMELLSGYIAQRLYKNLKCRGYDVSISTLGRHNTLEIRNCSDSILTELNVIKGLGIDVICIK